MRNEKVLIVVLAYTIGFTTAFIGFGIGSDRDSATTDAQQRPVAQASVSETEETMSPPAEQASLVQVLAESDGLYALVGGQKKIISAKDPKNNDTEPGFHYATPIYSASGDGEYVHFCEQSTADSNVCNHVVYVVARNVLHKVEHDETQYASPIANVAASWMPDGRLIVDDLISDNAEEPWNLIHIEDTLAID